MKKRSKMSKPNSKRDFSHKARRVHPKNTRPVVMRGGIRF
nr:MAG: hypothetical protein [Microvirus sp.]